MALFKLSFAHPQLCGELSSFPLQGGQLSVALADLGVPGLEGVEREGGRRLLLKKLKKSSSDLRIIFPHISLITALNILIFKPSHDVPSHLLILNHQPV